jgi:hypothetical protein
MTFIQSSSTSIRYGANFKVIGKVDPQKLSYKGAFSPIKGTLFTLAEHISKGHPWMPAILDKGSRRWQQHANSAEVLAADIDSGMTLAQAVDHPFIASYCGLAIESSSSTQEKEKFRLVFRLPRAVTDWQTIRICNRYLIELLGVADPSCKDASRFFFGAPGRSPFLLNEIATLPAEFVDQAIAWNQEEERILEEKYQAAAKRRQQHQTQDKEDNLHERVREALTFIPPRSPGSGNYEESIRVLMALFHEFGEADAITLGEWWSPSIKGTTWDVPKKIRSFHGSTSRPVTIGTLFKLAFQNGYKIPKKEAEPLGWLRRVLRPGAKSPKHKKIQTGEPSLVAQFDSIYQYSEGTRLETWLSALQKGYKHILDNSETGTGKSHEAGLTTPDSFGAEQLIYVSPQHRNPTTTTLKEWDDLEARHNGLVREQTTNGDDRWRRAKKGETPSISGNCNRTGIIEVLRSKEVQGADTANLICGTCTSREACVNNEGSGYGFLFQRSDILKSSRFRAHPASLPAPAKSEQEATDQKSDEFTYKDTVMIWDEASETFTTKRSITVGLNDLRQTILALMPHSDIFTKLQPMLTVLLSYLDGSTFAGKYGLDHLIVVSKVPMPDVPLEAIADILTPNLGFLNTTAQYGADLADLPSSVRKKFAEKDGKAADFAEEKVIKQWIVDFVKVLSGEEGHLHLSNKKLTISLPNERQREIVKAAKATIFLDATLTPEDLALKLGCRSDEIFVCRQQTHDYQNLKIIQVADLGRLGRQRGADQQRRARAIVAHYQQEDPTTKVVDFKDLAEEECGVWWRDTRGVNDFEQVKRLILTGTPCRNLADLLAEYAILTGIHDPEDLGFRAFVDRAIRADFQQGKGRLRNHRRPDEQLELIVLSDFDLQLPNLTCIAAEDVTVEAASKAERLLIAARRAIAKLQKEGEKVTQTAVAALCNCSQQRISQFWHLLKTLLEITNSKSSKATSKNLVADLVPITEAVISTCPQERSAESVAEIFFQWVEPNDYQLLWQNLTAESQIWVLEFLLLTLPKEQIQSLCSDR